ncbi:probable ATP-dependent RNA helicase Dbp73D [Wyeomyia smithii]|uniref:probable ATP-dependent RNA helicase Dbp73D n=1 Tax=Wyeomyia smithii TaxID=174621 RepID=UPI00246820A0|nr:probable ATP-dependent RNA helicase Dbp73D [Wyeomyia smithii]XP_055535371.1 probable ATP-dependent RNA helicase Dbp73D [Wyeomyia smithii]
MALFAVNRYDEPKLSKEDESLQENLFLQRLESRKRNKEKEVSPTKEIIAKNDVVTDNESDKESNAVEKDEGNDLVLEESSNLAKENGQPIKESVKPIEQEFQLLGHTRFEKLKEVESILPPWLSHPTIIDGDFTRKGKSIKKLPYLDEQLKINLKNMSYKRLFPVQEVVIPWILDVHRKPAPFWPRDVCISSPTGSGKTLAFAVPIVQMLLNRIAPAVRALVILPVKELAEQVFVVFEKLCKGTKVRPLLLSRKQTFSIEQSKLVDCFNGSYMPKVDIIVTTAGRLVEHLHTTKGFTLRQLRFLIIDEADRVMDQIQNDWLYHLNKHVKEESDEYLLGRTAGQLSQTELFDKPRQPHKLLFSATLSQDSEKLKTFRLFHPKLFTAVANPEKWLTNLAKHHALAEEKRGKFIGQYATPVELRELICLTQYKIKPLTLFALIKENSYKRFLCFTSSIDSSHRLSFVLQKMFGDELIIEEWSSSLSPVARKNVLNRFSLGKVNGIICTDALARGIDIDDIEVVISYDMPRHVNTYIHRIGRTGRAGRQGTSITMLIDEQRKTFKTILAEAGKDELELINIKSNAEEEYAVLYSNALNDLREALELEKQTMNKIRNGISIANMTKVNLLSKLKDRVDIDTGNSKEMIKSLLHLPKAWSNEAIEQKANQNRKRKSKNHDEKVDICDDKLPTGDADLSAKKRKIASSGKRERYFKLSTEASSRNQQ